MLSAVEVCGVGEGGEFSAVGVGVVDEEGLCAPDPGMGLKDTGGGDEGGVGGDGEALVEQEVVEEGASKGDGASDKVADSVAGVQAQELGAVVMAQ